MWRYILICLLLAACSQAKKFDRDRWLNADLDGRERAEMVPSLLRTHPLIGLHRHEVVALLGDPTKSPDSDEAIMVYVLGNDGTMFAIDNEYLEIHLDKTDRVTSFRRTKD